MKADYNCEYDVSNSDVENMLQPAHDFLNSIIKLIKENNRSQNNMEDYDKLMVGDQSTDGRIIIADKDRLCYLVKSGSKGSFSIRTISKQLLGEFIDYYRKIPTKG